LGSGLQSERTGVCPGYKCDTPYITNKVKFDIYGRASFPAVPSATYDVFGWTLYNGHHLAWDLQVDLKAGANTIVLDQRNAIALQ